MKKQTKIKAKNALCRMCKNDCKDMYKYGAQNVKAGCYHFRREDRVNG